MKHGKKIAAGIIPIHPPSGKVMMIRRGMNQSHPNTWSFFGGKFEEEDGNPKETAKREFTEESGNDSIKYYISTKPVYVNSDNHLRFYNYIGIFTEQFVPDLEKENEAQDYGWFDIDNLPHNMHPGAVELFDKKSKLINQLIDYYR